MSERDSRFGHTGYDRDRTREMLAQINAKDAQRHGKPPQALPANDPEQLKPQTGKESKNGNSK